MIGGALDFFTVSSKEIHMVAVKNCNFFLIKEIYIPCVLQNRRNITCDKVFTLTKTYNEWTFLAGSNNAVRKILAHYTKRIRTFQLLQGHQHCLKNLACLFVIIIDKVGNNFRISLTAEYNPLILKPCLESSIIFNDTVMNNRNRAAFVGMGMGIQFTGLTMRCPTGMTNTDVSLYKISCFFNCRIQRFFVFCLSCRSIFVF